MLTPGSWQKKDSQRDGVVGEFMSQDWNVEEEDFVRIYGEFGEVSNFMMKPVSFTHLMYTGLHWHLHVCLYLCYLGRLEKEQL